MFSSLKGINMPKTIFQTITIFMFLVLTACSNGDPGALKGTWKVTGIIPMVITFRNGETESLGIIEKVSYKTDNDNVLVTYENGLMQGTSIRFNVINTNTVKSQLGTLKRIN